MIRLILISIFTLMCCFNAYSENEPENIVKFRDNLMNLLKYNISSIAQVAKNEISYTDNLIIYAENIQALLANADSFFISGTGPNIKGSQALDKIWNNREEFRNIFKEASDKAIILTNAVQSKDINDIGKAVGELGKKCGSCHKKFREKKN